MKNKTKNKSILQRVPKTIIFLWQQHEIFSYKNVILSHISALWSRMYRSKNKARVFHPSFFLIGLIFILPSFLSFTVFLSFFLLFPFPFFFFPSFCRPSFLFLFHDIYSRKVDVEERQTGYRLVERRLIKYLLIFLLGFVLLSFCQR